MADDNLEPSLKALPQLDVTPAQASSLRSRARGSGGSALFSRIVVPAGLALTAVLYLHWALQVTVHP